MPRRTVTVNKRANLKNGLDSNGDIADVEGISPDEQVSNPQSRRQSIDAASSTGIGPIATDVVSTKILMGSTVETTSNRSLIQANWYTPYLYIIYIYIYIYTYIHIYIYI